MSELVGVVTLYLPSAPSYTKLSPEDIEVLGFDPGDLWRLTFQLDEDSSIEVAAIVDELVEDYSIIRRAREDSD